MRLRYAGRYPEETIKLANFKGDPRLWDVFDKGRVYHGSTMSLEGLKEVGIVKSNGESK